MHAVDKGALPNLKVLLLAGCASITHLPDMSSLRNLETLNISECTRLLVNLPRGLVERADLTVRLSEDDDLNQYLKNRYLKSVRRV